MCAAIAQLEYNVCFTFRHSRPGRYLWRWLTSLVARTMYIDERMHERI